MFMTNITYHEGRGIWLCSDLEEWTPKSSDMKMPHPYTNPDNEPNEVSKLKKKKKKKKKKNYWAIAGSGGWE